MTTLEQIDNDYIREAKARNKPVVSALRMLKAALKNAQIEKQGELNEDEVIEVIGREFKKMKDALETYRDAGRQEMVEQAEAEIIVFQNYLPQPLDEATVKEIVKSKIAELGASTPKDMGRVMAEVMKETKGRTDGSVVSALVKSALVEVND